MSLRRSFVVVGFCSAAFFAEIAPAVAGTPVELATPQQKQQAQGEFKNAMKSFEAKKFDEALTGFRASYDSVASPNSRLMVARTLAQLGRVGEAYAELLAVAQEAERAAQADPKYADTAKSARAEMDEVRPRTGFVTISGAAAEASVKVAGRDVAHADLAQPVPVDPGSVSVVVSGAGGEQKRDVSVAAGATVAVDFAAAAAPSAAEVPPGEEPAAAAAESAATVNGKPLDKRTLAYIAGGVGAAGLLTFGIFGLMNNAKHSDLEDKCPDGHCPPELADEADTGRTYQTVANVGLVVGIVGAGAGVFLYLTSKPKESQATSLVLGPGNVSVRGRF